MSTESATQQPFDDNRYWRRLGAMLTLGILIAGFLTWFMYVLIEFTEQPMDESARAQILDFVRLQREEVSQQRERRLERPETTEAPPVPSAPDFSDARSELSPLAVSHIPVGDGGGVDVGGFGVGMGDGEYLPIVKVAPVYPAAAAHRRVQGECLVEFTVTTSGSTRDIVIVEERCPEAVFRRPSIEATSKFKYQPRIIDGEAVEVRGVKNLFIYQLEAAPE